MLRYVWQLFKEGWKSLFAVGGVVGLLYLWPDIRDLPSAYGYEWGQVMPGRETLAYVLLGIALLWLVWVDLRPTVRTWIVERSRRLPPELDEVKDKLILNGPPRLGVTIGDDGRMTEAQVQLNITDKAGRSISYTMHKFHGSMNGISMPDVVAPSYGGEILP